MERETRREAFSARQVSRAYGIAMRTILDAIGTHELRASRLGAKRYTVLRQDVESWIRSKSLSVPPNDHAHRIVASVLEREDGP